jgi:hypothetical protein
VFGDGDARVDDQGGVPEAYADVGCRFRKPVSTAEPWITLFRRR